MMPRVALQVVAYWSEAGKEDLDRCLASLVELAYPREQVCLIIVDNPSPYGTARAHIQATWSSVAGLPELILIDSAVNSGYAGGHQRAYAAAREWGAEYVYLLNQDAYVDTRMLEEVVRVAQEQPHCALVQSVLRAPGEAGRVDSFGNVLHFLGFGYQDPDGTRPHFYASGAGVLVRTSALEQLGELFDADLFMYHDDVDLAWRLRLMGYGVATATASTVYHRYEFSRSITKFYWMERNRHLVAFSHYRLATLLLIAPALIAMEFGTFLFSLKSGWWREKLRSWFFFYTPTAWRWIARRRRAVKRLRCTSDRALLGLMTGAVEAQEVENWLLTRVANPLFRLYLRLLTLLVRW